MNYAYAEDIVAALGATGDLRAEIEHRYASRSRGGVLVTAEGIQCLSAWAQAVSLVTPTLEWSTETRGSHILVRPRVRARLRPRGVDPLQAAYRILEGTIERAWGTRRRRYHTTPGGLRRLRRDQAAVAAAWAIVLPLVTEAIADAVQDAIDTPYWHVTYRWALPSPDCLARGNRVGNDSIYPEGVDPQMPHLRGRPVSPAAYRVQQAELRQLATTLEEIRPKLLAVASVEQSYEANRAGYLPALAGIRSGLPAGIYAAIEADPELCAHAERLRLAALH